ncbi:transglycosylase SLT domain-containing protein [Streptomyces sp. SP17BM10]|uniref:aggregation-promoting factor C-terminal-like domain-containing protein n=1 Tax=Streptomyces sp. SP17BM10 TaxID=3002530 RepID=UPI002E76E13B|nr:transglycosylase SLT domain-containing protein [Streptomyces sp. SP17BM10]MEE1786328.1 transglycosylase SLT domain-containing protein [Streptomyces sp. SP17BM10]
MPLSHARRNSLITGVATLVVASAATAALAIPQAGDTAEAATPVAAVSVADQAARAPQAPQADAAQAQAQAAQTQAAQTQADAAAAAQAQAQQAAAQAQAEADAKAQADAKAKADAEAAASRSQQRPALSAPAAAPTGTPQQIAAQLVPAGQLQCFSNIVSHESSWNPLAVNASSGAYGLVQALPGSKMASAGSDWRTNPATQIKWGLDYMNSRYGSPCGAWSFWQAHHWY